MKKSLLTILILLLWVGSVCAETLYVRPAGGTYGAEDGSTYAAAWDGLSSVVWGDGAGKVGPGDTLYVCGTHVREATLPSVVAGQLYWPGVTGTANARVVIASCEVQYGASTDDPASITYLYKDSRTDGVVPSNWDDCANGCPDGAVVLTRAGVYYNKTDGSTAARRIFASDAWESYTSPAVNIPMTLVASYNDVDAVGDFYVNFDDAGDYSEIFAYPSDVANLTGNNIRYNGIYAWIFTITDNVDYFDIIGIDILYGSIHYDGRSAVGNAHYSIQDCVIQGAESAHSLAGPQYLFTPQTSTDALIHGNTFSNGGNGIYIFWDRCPYSGFTISDNIFTGIGQVGIVDGHAIGVQNGEDLLVEGNIISDCASGIDLHVGATLQQHNAKILRNFVSGSTSAYGTASEGCGIIIEGDNTNPVAYTSGTEVGYNIVTGCDDLGIFVGRKSHVDVYNNVSAYNNYNYKLMNSTDDGGDIDFYNNISYEPVTLHAYFNQNSAGVSYYASLDNNIFYPIAGDQFYYLDSGTACANVNTSATYAEWNTLLNSSITEGCNRSDVVANANSYITDPLFMSVGGYQLQPTSDAVNHGEIIPGVHDVAGYIDIMGKPIVGVPDIGAFESGSWSVKAGGSTSP